MIKCKISLVYRYFYRSSPSIVWQCWKSLQEEDNQQLVLTIAIVQPELHQVVHLIARDIQKNHKNKTSNNEWVNEDRRDSGTLEQIAHPSWNKLRTYLGIYCTLILENNEEMETLKKRA